MLSRTIQFRYTFILFTSLCVLANGQDCLAQDEVLNGSGEDSARDYPRHRINLGALFLDQVSSDSFNGIVGYTYNLTHNANIGVTVPYIDPDTSAAGNSGIGDTIVALSFVPSVRIGANPWVPRTVGTGIAVLAPTGDPDERRSLDSWVVAPYLGLIIPLSEKFFFAPQLGYVHSLDKTAAGTDLRIAFAETGFGFVAFNGFWASYFPNFSFDVESDDWAINHRLAIGKMLSKNFGLSVDYTYIERFNFGSNLPGESGFDRQIDLNVHFAF